MAQNVLGQQLITGTATSIYSPPPNVEASGMVLTVVQYGPTGSITFTVFIDEDGNAHGDDNTIYDEVPIVANQTIQLSIPPLSNSAGNVKILASAASELTATLHGKERYL